MLLPPNLNWDDKGAQDRNPCTYTHISGTKMKTITLKNLAIFLQVQPQPGPHKGLLLNGQKPQPRNAS